MAGINSITPYRVQLHSVGQLTGLLACLLTGTKNPGEPRGNLGLFFNFSDFSSVLGVGSYFSEAEHALVHVSLA